MGCSSPDSDLAIVSFPIAAATSRPEKERQHHAGAHRFRRSADTPRRTQPMAASPPLNSRNKVIVNGMSCHPLKAGTRRQATQGAIHAIRRTTSSRRPSIVVRRRRNGPRARRWRARAPVPAAVRETGRVQAAWCRCAAGSPVGWNRSCETASAASAARAFPSVRNAGLVNSIA